jgi:hypothetical protein
MIDLAPLHVLMILAIVVVALSMIAALIDTIRDRSLTLGAQVGWAALIVLIPGFGVLVWTVVRLARNGSVRYAPRLSAEER